jgi:hypothetical protein
MLPEIEMFFHQTSKNQAARLGEQQQCRIFTQRRRKSQGKDSLVTIRIECGKMEGTGLGCADAALTSSSPWRFFTERKKIRTVRSKKVWFIRKKVETL